MWSSLDPPISDNQAVEEPSGAMRGFDALSGKLLWPGSRCRGRKINTPALALAMHGP